MGINTQKQQKDSTEIKPIKKSTKKDKKVRFQYFLEKLNKNTKLNDSQKTYIEQAKNNTLIFCYGPAGTAKTYSTCYILLKSLFEGKIEKIIFSKPIKESGENLGFLPGDIQQKIEPYSESFIYICKELLDTQSIEFLVQNELIEFRPLAYMRGITFNNCGLFLDEAQNCLTEQVILYITRLGQNSKMILAGDITQADIDKKKVVFHEFISFLNELDGVTIFTFKRNDIVRNSLLIQITEKYEEWKESKILNNK